MDEYKRSSHAVYDIKYHIIWVTKYRYHVLRGDIARRVRELIRQGCEARGITILQGSVGKDHIHLLLSCPPSIAPSKKKRYWGQHLWARGYFCATVGNVTEEIIRNYIENQTSEKRNDIFRIDD
ncbi:IS200/IS605 family transposase [Salicibibacter cibarius]|uniref:IS200/IS605 family transposase n=1 Tax=Salicibibacter cibarius TaxID=2743000 RepID=A0A7T7CA79_9BACI|nr:IS200/IS605 family transposase [Salicibibacter cibarius]QQK74612.1 IS200/IS605 family transposase [Salicibibacter cibarius]